MVTAWLNKRHVFHCKGAEKKIPELGTKLGKHGLKVKKLNNRYCSMIIGTSTETSSPLA